MLHRGMERRREEKRDPDFAQALLHDRPRQPTTNWLVYDSADTAPKNRRDQTVGIRMEIRIEHAASSEAFDDAQLLDPKQHKRCPDVIEQLDSDEQNPKRNLVLVALSCESNAVMPNKHLNIVD